MKTPILLTSLIAFAASAAQASSYTQDWGIGMGVRSATIPYKLKDDSVHDVIPLLFYRGERFYLDGFQGGYKLLTNDTLTWDVMGKFRFLDIPRSEQNIHQGSQFDFGSSLTYHYTPETDFKLEVLSDGDSRYYGNIVAKHYLEGASWQLTPFVQARYKSERFNDLYYSFGEESIGAQWDYQVGAKGRYQLYENLYAVGSLGMTVFDNTTYNSDTIDSRTQWESYLGFALFSSGERSTETLIPDNAYFRVAHGVATKSGPTELIFLNNETDPERNKLTSLFYGHPLAQGVFNWPLDFYLTPGYVQHHRSDVQESFVEYVIAIKAYYTWNLPVRTRFGLAEGVSYSSKISHIEASNMAKKGYKPSKLMNYLDFSVDVNVGDIVANRALENLWLGYSIHHRSGIFTSTSTFGRIKGGSDYNTLYLQWHF
ncbi:MipA/OmpV family protein [Vibrio astriarenae]|uniref:MipA/OmpV family protein n=1 Tax=Vibrio astriarenae TaxID=1481923 RepID=UPI003734F993